MKISTRRKGRDDVIVLAVAVVLAVPVLSSTSRCADQVFIASRSHGTDGFCNEFAFPDSHSCHKPRVELSFVRLPTGLQRTLLPTSWWCSNSSRSAYVMPVSRSTQAMKLVGLIL